MKKWVRLSSIKQTLPHGPLDSVIAMPPQKKNKVFIKSPLQMYAARFQVASYNMWVVEEKKRHYKERLANLEADTSRKTRTQMVRWQEEIELCEKRLEELNAQRW